MKDSCVRIQAGDKYCSGVFIASDLGPARGASRLILTCAHFWRDIQRPPRITNSRSRIRSVRAIIGTDLAVVLLDKPGPVVELPAVGKMLLLPGQALTTFGFGGRKRKVQNRKGRFLIPIPVAVSRNFSTTTRHGFLALSSAIHGDSGGPVMAGNKLIGVQSLVFDPLGFNLHVATVARVDKHLPALHQAIAALYHA